MAGEINFALLQQPDFTKNALSMFTAGREVGDDNAMRNALSGYDPSNPNSLDAGTTALIRRGAVKQAGDLMDFGYKGQQRKLLIAGQQALLGDSDQSPQSAQAPAASSAPQPAQTASGSVDAVSLDTLSAGIQKLRAVPLEQRPALAATILPPDKAQGLDLSDQALDAAESHIAAANQQAAAPQSAQPAPRPAVSNRGVDLRRAAPALTAMAMGGMNVAPLVDIGKATTPTLSADQDLDANGNVINLPGAVQASSAMAGATSAATEKGKADYDVISVNKADGSTAQMPRSLFVQLQQQGLLAPGVGVSQNTEDKSSAEARGKLPYTPDNRTDASGHPVYGTAVDRMRNGVSLAASNGDPGLRGQSPAEKITADTAATTQATRTAGLPAAKAGLDDLKLRTDTIGSTINQAKSLISPWTTGPGAILGAIPGTPARDLQAHIETLKANLSLAGIAALRAEGGSLGRTTQQEFNTIAQQLGNMDPHQSSAALSRSLDQIQAKVNKQLKIQSDAFASTYTAPQAKASPQTPKPSAGGFAGHPQSAWQAAAAARLAALGGGQ